MVCVAEFEDFHGSGYKYLTTVEVLATPVFCYK